jgi:trigger factor
MNEKPSKVRAAYERNDLVPELVAQIRKSKALDWLVHNVRFTDADGVELDRDLILGHTHGPNGEHLDDHHHHDHDHDHHDHDHTDHDHADETEVSS